MPGTPLTLMDPNPHTNPAIAMSGRTRRWAFGLVLILLVVAASACGGSDDATSSAAEPASASLEADESGDDDPASVASNSIDLTAVSDCIAAADIVVAPTSYSDAYLAEQGIAATLDLGALGVEFGGGQLFVFESVERAEEMAASFAAVGDAAVRQDGATVVQYASAVQDEAADIVMACAS